MRINTAKRIGTAVIALALAGGVATACDSAKEAGDQAKDAAASATDKAGQAASDAKDKAGSAASDVTGGASEGAQGNESGQQGANGGEGDSAPKPAVESTSIADASGTDVALTDKAIIAEYASKGYEKGYLGKPLGPVVPLKGGGKFITFENGSIYVNPESGKAFITQGKIGEFWKENGNETGKLGYPTSNEEPVDGGGLKQSFTNGTLTWKDGKVTES